MTIGMEVAFKLGFYTQAGGLSSMTNVVFPTALKEAAYMGLLVLLFSNLWGNRLGAKIAVRHADPTRDNPYFCRLMRQAGTVGVMCPIMSLCASVFFNIVLVHGTWNQLPAIWIGTMLKNFPMAFFWNLYAAAPFTHWLFGVLFNQKES